MNCHTLRDMLPMAMGNEEERMLMTGPSAAKLADDVEFSASFAEYLPENIRKVAHGKDEALYVDDFFLSNGDRLYAEGENNHGPAKDRYVEWASAECSDPAEMARLIQKGEQLHVAMLGRYVMAAAERADMRVVRAQRRAIDSQGHTRGCHDNFELRDPGLQMLLNNDYSVYAHAKQAQEVLVADLYTRGSLTGAGLVAHDSLQLSQKTGCVSRISGHLFGDTAYDVSDGIGTGRRCEIRCSDINILPPAIVARFAGTASLLCLLRTELVQDLADYVPEPSGSYNEADLVRRFRLYNGISISEDGSVRPTEATWQAYDFQQRKLELIGEKLGNYIDIPAAYRDPIRDMREYYDDYQKVLLGQETITLLADRSDAFAKFSHVLEHLQADRASGKTRSLFDLESQADDLKYDCIALKLGDNGQPKVAYGRGYELRRTGRFRGSAGVSDMGEFSVNPPETTRAYIRGNLIKQGIVQACDWDEVIIAGANGAKVGLPRVMLDGPGVDYSGLVRHQAASVPQMLAVINDHVDANTTDKKRQ
jgi:hypothetical protein